MQIKNKGIKYLSGVEMVELFNVINRDTSLHSLRNKAIFALAKYCALRVSEISLLKLYDFDLTRETIYCRRLKGSNNNTLKIVEPDLLDLLDRYVHYLKMIFPDTNTLFPSQTGEPISRYTLNNLIKSYCKETLIPPEKHHFHVLKHSRAIELIETEGVSVYDIQYWLGHKYIQNTLIYLEYTPVAMNKLFNLLKKNNKC